MVPPLVELNSSLKDHLIQKDGREITTPKFPLDGPMVAMSKIGNAEYAENAPSAE